MDVDGSNADPAPAERTSVWTGVGRLAVDGAVPLVAFWAVRRYGGMVPGVLAAAVAAGVLLLVRHRSGRRGVAAALAAGLVAVNAVVGLTTRSETAYLAQGVVVTAVMGLAFGLSAATRRPLAGVLAADIYGLPAAVWEDRLFLRTFRVVSLVWAAFEALSAGVRALTLSSTGTFVLVSIVLGVPGTVALFWWSVRYADKRIL